MKKSGRLKAYNAPRLTAQGTTTAETESTSVAASSSKVFCMLPWVHMSVMTDGRVLPCCVSDWERPVGNLRESSLRELWNSSGIKQLRQNMRAGRKSLQCRFCYKLEEGGFPSMRQYANERFASHFASVEATRKDGSLEHLRMPFMDIRFSNVCNFKCRICSPLISSSWYEDAKALWKDYSAPQIMTPTKNPEDLWRQIEPLIPWLEEINFTGGEPLINDEHYQLLNLLIQKKLFNVRLRYSTNFSIMTHRGQDVLRLWRQFRSVDVRASLDDSGRRGEYLRKGLSWEQILKNRRLMADACPHAKFSIEATVCLMNAFHLPDFHNEWLELGLVAPGHWCPHILDSPEEYSIQVLPEHLKRQVAEKYEKHIAKVLRPLAAAADEQTYRSIISFMTARDESHLLPKFRETTRRLDRLRGENFTRTFPELACLMKG